MVDRGNVKASYKYLYHGNQRAFSFTTNYWMTGCLCFRINVAEALFTCSLPLQFEIELLDA